jgi:hypothetical protein
MIIAFYPGAGGNRYLRMLENKEWESFNKFYDFSVHGQSLANRYLLEDVRDTDQPHIILTHCLNATRLKTMFPDRNIVFIIGDFKSCLRREWAVAGHSRFVKLEESKKINFDRLQHYNSFKDQLWPNCNTSEEIDQLPKTILAEISSDYSTIVKETSTELDKVKKNILSKVDSSFENISWHKNYYEQYPVEIDAESEVIEISSGSDKFCQVMRQELSSYHSEIFDQVWHNIYE